jgi:hypothetical protein
MELERFSRRFGDSVADTGCTAKVAQTLQSLVLRLRRNVYVSAHALCGSSCSLICCGCEYGRMPNLYPPSGVLLQPRGGGGGGGSWHTDAMTTMDRPVSELESHFADQLREAGWKRLDGRADEVVAWSSWQLPGKGKWRGLLLVLAAFGHGQRVLGCESSRASRAVQVGVGTLKG